MTSFHFQIDPCLSAVFASRDDFDAVIRYPYPPLPASDQSRAFIVAEQSQLADDTSHKSFRFGRRDNVFILGGQSAADFIGGSERLIHDLIDVKMLLRNSDQQVSSYALIPADDIHLFAAKRAATGRDAQGTCGAASSQDRFVSIQPWTYPMESIAFSIGDRSSEPVVLGEGSLGAVFQAWWNMTKVAVKQLHFMDENPARIDTIGGRLSESDRAGVFADFLEECRINAQLRHPNVVAFLGVITDRDANSPRYLMLEYMAGGTLHSLLRSPVGVDRLNEILFDVCKALCYLHTRQPAVLHLDVKPKNILLDRSGTAKIADLGEAHVVRSATLRAGTVGVLGVGTLDYMAPEMQIQDEIKTGKADMFSFGVVAVECATRQAPSPLPPFRREGDHRVCLSEEERRAHDLRAINQDLYPHLLVLARNLVVDRVADRWDALQTLNFLSYHVNHQ